MGGGSIIGAIVGAVAAPLTGGASLAAVAAGAGIGAAAGSTLIDQPRAAKKQAQVQAAAIEEQRKAQIAQQRIAEIQNQRARIAQARQARQQRAIAMSRAVNLTGAIGGGISGISPAAGTISSIGSQLGTNLSFINTSESLGQQAIGFQRNATGFLTQANEFARDLSFAQNISNIGLTVFDQFWPTAGVDELKK